MFGGAYGDACMPNWPHRHRTPLPGVASPGLRRNKGECFEAGYLSAPISILLLECVDGATILPLRRILSLAGILAASECLRVRPAWIVFFLLVAGFLTANTSGVWHWVLGDGGYASAPPRNFHLATHCQSDKSGHLVPFVCAFQHNWDQTVRCKRLFSHLLLGGHCVLPVQLKCQTLKQGVPGIIISPSFITVGAIEAPCGQT